LTHFAAQGFCAVAWDARGYGDSDDSPQPLQFADFADDLCRLLDHLGAARAHLVGLSMGGMIVQDVYGRYAERVATLALVDTSAGFGTVPEAVRRDFLARRLDPLTRGLTPADIAPDVVDVLVAKGASAVVREQLRASMGALRVASYQQALQAIVSTDFRAVLPRIRVPTLVLVGEEDIVTPPAEAVFLATHIPGATLVRLPGAGHLTNLEAPAAFDAALQTFFYAHASQAASVSRS
jgi:pimeloyl-ACP methyl ester carboxylesterase